MMRPNQIPKKYGLMAVGGMLALGLVAAGVVYAARVNCEDGEVCHGTSTGDTIFGTAGADEIHAYGGHDYADAFGGNDRLYGGAGHDMLDGQAGDDWLRGGPGRDILIGNEGRDAVDYRNITGSGVTILMDCPIAEEVVTAEEATEAKPATAKCVIGAPDSADPRPAGDPNDVYPKAATDESVRVYPWSWNGDEGAGANPGAIVGGHRVNAPGTQADGDVLQSVENVRGTHQDDIITGKWDYGNDNAEGFFGSSLNENIWGHGGNDVIRGHHGDDHLYGNDGNDFVVGGPGDDYIEGGNGNDVLGHHYDGTLVARNAPDMEYGNDEIHGGAGDDTINGGPGNDELRGGEGVDYIDGNAGEDLIYGGPGDDNNLFGNDGHDAIWGGDGNDRIAGHSGNDMLHGGNGNDTLYAGSGGNTGWNDGVFDGDRLYGGPDDDLLIDDLSNGNSMMWGGLGTDTFLFKVPNHGWDKIHDFSSGETLVMCNASATRKYAWNAWNASGNRVASTRVDSIINQNDVQATVVLVGFTDRQNLDVKDGGDTGYETLCSTGAPGTD